MALVSPGIEVTVIDESQYLPSAVGTVPFVVIATAENKTINGVIAPGTTKANAGKAYGITSQRELATTFGAPIFRRTVNDTPIHGDELNEYGLMAAYSALGLGNRAWVVRADINLDDLVGTSVRPVGNPVNGTNWLDTATSTWGIYEFDESISVLETPFVEKTPIVISSLNDVTGSPSAPLNSIGNKGDYAVVVTDDNNFIYKKNYLNNWVALGSSTWADTLPVVKSSLTSVSSDITNVLTGGATMTINNVDVVFSVTTSSMTAFANVINTTSNLTGISATVADDRVEFRITAAAASDGVTADGLLVITDGTGSPASRLGLLGDVPANPANTAASSSVTVNGTTWTWNVGQQRWRGSSTFRRAAVSHGGFASAPLWRRSAATPRPSGSVWVKTSVQGSGTNLVYRRYNALTKSWVKLAVPVHKDGYEAIYNLDRVGGGTNIAVGSVFAKYEPSNNGSAGFEIYTQRVKGQTKVVGSNTTMAMAAGDAFTMKVSQPNTDPSITAPTVTTITVGAVSGAARGPQQAFVQAILGANIPNVTAQVESTGAVSITHRSGGIITVTNTSGNPIGNAGFTTSTVGVTPDVVPGSLNLTNWTKSVYTYSASQPFTAPIDGKLWYYNDATAVDIMISDATGWKGYKNVSSDARGYDLTLTDPNGVIVSATEPESQSDNTVLENGDLWLDTSDLENYPKLYRYNRVSATWSLVDTTDQVSQNGIIFADARWDASLNTSSVSVGGLVDPVSGEYPSTVTMLTSDYVDPDCPDYRLYPRGTLLFNTRRSGFTVKKFVVNYFNSTAFPLAQALPTHRSTWVSQLGLKSSGAPAMGRYAQRNEVVQAMKAAVDGNLDLREEGYAFNLLTAPGYPELIPNLVALNNDRAQTGFVIGDTPMTLSNTTGELIDYSNNQAVTGSAYLALYYPSALTNDLSGNEIAVPASHMMLRTFLYSDQVSYQWFAPAGTRRGLIDNAVAIGYVDANSGEFIRTGIRNSLRDVLYENRLNPITLINGTGLVAFGQKTRAPTIGTTGSAVGGGSALDRVNVARLVNYLRTILGGVASQFLFEPNDKITRDQIKQLIESLLNDLVAKRGVYDYLVVCDESNNTSDRIARNELYVDIAIEPVRAVEFIYIPLRLKNPGTIAGTATTAATV
jgi:hypothetical protein